jgi:putative FmdB family regulatory protein
MPTYEYVCAKCDHRFEKFQSMKDDALKICPADLCPKKKWGKGKVQRQMGGGAGLIFKGSGFYITDYRSKGYQESAKKDSSGASSASASSAAAASAAASASAGPPRNDLTPPPRVAACPPCFHRSPGLSP